MEQGVYKMGGIEDDDIFDLGDFASESSAENLSDNEAANAQVDEFLANFDRALDAAPLVSDEQKQADKMREMAKKRPESEFVKGIRAAADYVMKVTHHKNTEHAAAAAVFYILINIYADQQHIQEVPQDIGTIGMQKQGARRPETPVHWLELALARVKDGESELAVLNEFGYFAASQKETYRIEGMEAAAKYLLDRFGKSGIGVASTFATEIIVYAESIK